jgi:hypothetical protein
MTYPATHRARVPAMIADYFRDYFPAEATHPIITQAFHPDRGWKYYPINKRVSVSWLRKMRAEGYTAIAVSDGRESGTARNVRRVVDFRIDSVLRHENRALRLRDAYVGVPVG